MPKKLDKYEIKFWVFADVQTKFVVNIILYFDARKKEKRGDISLAQSEVMSLVECVRNKVQHKV